MPMPFRKDAYARTKSYGRPFEFTVLSLRVGRILVAEKGKGHWTYELSRRIRINRGTTYAVLRQFQQEGWVRNWTAPGDRKTPRVVYELTDSGFAAIAAALEPLQITKPST